jgi:hypothetical protein
MNAEERNEIELNFNIFLFNIIHTMCFYMDQHQLLTD